MKQKITITFEWWINENEFTVPVEDRDSMKQKLNI